MLNNEYQPRIHEKATKIDQHYNKRPSFAKSTKKLIQFRQKLSTTIKIRQTCIKKNRIRQKKMNHNKNLAKQSTFAKHA